jgi:hypothetical protein
MDTARLSEAGFDRTGVARFSLSMQYQLILFAGAIAFSLALLSPWPAFIGAGAELLYLGLHFGEAWLRRRRKQAEVAERMKAWATKAQEEERDLDVGYAARVATLSKQVGELTALAGERGLNAAVLGSEDHLGGLVASFKRLCVLHQRLNRLIATTPVAPINDELARLEREAQREPDPAVRASLTEAMHLGQRRLRQQAQLEARRRAVGVKLGTLETSVEFLRSHIQAGTPEPNLVAEIAEIVSTANAPLPSTTQTGSFTPIKVLSEGAKMPPPARPRLVGLADR